ncbi:NAD dependent epimerase/dehydratase family protein [Mycobacterium ulcerans str. Harvey]|uniref:NAD dependent epimerase/dehydratase family protein n=1 Tax=Mycobacterium ulcerans str. Harvey TaxID=1299332 RepID=A0ABP3AL81_MYCUL|nr:NAD dependent epimerase/dehydratase family protein [Mycobacterium ulcerans str. Harvey]
MWVLVRRQSLSRFERLATDWGDRVKPLVGELPELPVTEQISAELGQIDHVVHCAAVYDITAGEDQQRAANVDGTRAVIELTRRLDATLHHVSSIAVAGDFAGEYTEADFDVGQQLPSPYHRTKFEAELLVRSSTGLRYRIYRPAVVVGDSRTGEMDKIDGLYYFFGVLARLAALPSLTPILLPDTGRTNIVPVDYVVDALVALIHEDNMAFPNGRTFHLTAPQSVGLRGIYQAVTKEAGLPRRGGTPRLGGHPGAQGTGRAKVLRNMAATQLGIPSEIFDVLDLKPTFISDETQKALRGSGVRLPDFAGYAPKLWRYWAQHLDPTVPSATIRGARWWAGTSSSPGHPAASGELRRSRSRNGADAYSRWPATPTRSTNWSPRSARAAARPTLSPATSPTPPPSNTPSKTSWAASDMSTTWSTTPAGRFAARWSTPPTACTTTNG